MTATSLPLPLGELLERLRAEGFSVTPGQYGRVFTVLESLIPNGSTTIDGQQLATLRGMLGPIVCRTSVEQEKFGAVFDVVMANAVATQISPPESEKQDEQIEDKETPTKRRWLVSLLVVLGAIALGVWLSDRYGSKSPPLQVIDSCAVDFRVKAVRGNVVTFENRSPGASIGLEYVWDFDDGSPTLITSQTLVQHTFEAGVDTSVQNRVTLRGAGCPLVDDPIPPTPNVYIPRPLSFLRLPVSTQYTLSNWVPLLLMGLTGLLGGGWWLLRRRRRQQLAAQRPTDGPFFLGFPPQDEAIQPSASLVSWAQQLQQREESERHVLAIGPTIRRTIQNGGMPTVQFESIKRRPRYLILIDERSAYDQQARLYAYVMGVLTSRSVEMDVFFFQSDPRYCWNENYPKGLPISDLFRLYSTHYLVLVTEGSRLFDYDCNEVVDWATEALGGWTSRALLTPVYPTNWHYLEAALSRFFILLPATPDGQFLLRDYLGQPDNVPSFEELLRQFKVLPGTPNRGIFAANTSQITVAEVANFLKLAIPGSNLDEKTEKWLFTWACATAVFPTPDWAITLAIGRALEQAYRIDGLVSSTNILRLTALPWLRQDAISEPLRTQLLAQLPPDVATVARKSVVKLLQDLRPMPGSIAYEEHQLRLWEQEYHLNQGTLGQLTNYQNQTDLIQDATIRQRLERQERLETRYQPAALLLVLLVPLLLYLTPPQKQVAGLLMPFFSRDSTTLDSAAFYNNRAVELFSRKIEYADSQYEQGVSLLARSLNHRATFAAVYNLNVGRFRIAAWFHDSTGKAGEHAVVLSPYGELYVLTAPIRLFDYDWVPDSAVVGQYLKQLASSRAVKGQNDSLFYWLNVEHQLSLNRGKNQEVGISRPVNRLRFDELANEARRHFASPGKLEFTKKSSADDPIYREPRLEFTGKPYKVLRQFNPTPTQLDSLIGLEAARVLLYSGGPNRSKTIRMPSMVVEDQKIAKEEPRPRPNKRRKAGRTPASTRVRKPNPPKSTTNAGPTDVRQTNTLPETSTPEPEKKVDIPATAGSEPAQVPPSVQQQPVQTTPVEETAKLDESNLEVVYEETTKCTGKNKLSIQLPNGEKRDVRLFEVIRLGNYEGLYSLTVYCDEEPQKIYVKSKSGFNFVKAFVNRGNLVIWTFYREARKVKKK